MTAPLQATGAVRPLRVVPALPSSILGLWAAYLLLAPTTGFAWIDSWHNEQRAVQIVLLSLTALVFSGFITFGPKPIRTKLMLPWWWWTFVAVGTVSATNSLMPLAAFAEIGLFVLLSALVMMMAAITSDRPEQMVRAARYFTLLIAAAHVLAVLVRYGASLHLGDGVGLNVFMLGYANPRFASALYAVLMPFVAAVAIDPSEPRVLRATAFVTLCLLWTINLGLGTRGIWFAYLLATPALMLLIGIQRPLRIVGAVVLSAALGLATFLALTADLSGTAGAGAALPTERLQTLTSRDVLWSLSWKAIQQHPLLGLGPMQFATLNSYVGAHPHNWPLQIASEWGLPGLGLLLVALGQVSVRLRDACKTGLDTNTAPLLAVTVALIYALVDGNLVMPVSQTAAALALGLAIGNGMRAKWKQPSCLSIRATTTGLVVLAGAAAVIFYAFQTFADQPRAAREFRLAHPDAWLVPRFWESGIIVPIDQLRKGSGTSPAESTHQVRVVVQLHH